MKPMDIRRDALSPGPNARPPNKDLDENLRASIAEHGILQPLLVRAVADASAYEIIAGARRWRCSESLDVIPCLVTSCSDPEAAVIGAVENLQRMDLSASEEAAAYERMIDAGVPAAEISARTGLPPARIRNHLAICRLPDAARQVVDKGGVLLKDVASVVKAIPPAAVVGIEEAVKLLGANNATVRWAIQRASSIFTAEEEDFDLSSATKKQGACLPDCPCAKRGLIPESVNARWSWAWGDPMAAGVKGVEGMVCFDPACLRRKRAQGARTSGRARRRELGFLVRLRVDKLREKYPDAKVVNALEDPPMSAWWKKATEWYRLQGPPVGDAGACAAGGGKKPARGTYYPVFDNAGGEEVSNKARKERPGAVRVRESLCPGCRSSALVVSGSGAVADEGLRVRAFWGCKAPAKAAREIKEAMRDVLAEADARKDQARARLVSELIPAVLVCRADLLALARAAVKNQAAHVFGYYFGLDGATEEYIAERLAKEIETRPGVVLGILMLGRLEPEQAVAFVENIITGEHARDAESPNA